MPGKQKEAKVRVGVEGARDVEQAARGVVAAWKQAGTAVGGAFRSARQSIGENLHQIANDALRTVTVVRTLSLAEAVASAREYRQEFTKLAVAAGTTVGSMRGELTRISRETLVSEERVAAWSRTVGRSTYSIAGARDSFAALHAEATATGKSVEEMGQLGVTLNQSLGVADDVEMALAKIRGQAEALGTVGGVSAFQDQLQAALSSMVGLSQATEEQRSKFTALVGLMGKGLAPRAATAAQQAITGFVEQRAPMLSMLGNIDIYDERGQLDPEKYAEGMRWLQRKYRRWIPDEKLRKVALRSAFGGGQQGAVAEAAFERGDWSDQALRKVAGAPPSTVAARAEAEYQQTEAGRAAGHEIEAARSMRSAADKLNKVADKWTQVFAKMPIAGQLGGSVVQATVGGLVREGVGRVFSPGKVATTVAGTAAPSLAGRVLGAAGVAARAAPALLTGASLATAGAAVVGGLAGAALAAKVAEKTGMFDTSLDKPRGPAVLRRQAEYAGALKERGVVDPDAPLLGAPAGEGLLGEGGPAGAVAGIEATKTTIEKVPDRTAKALDSLLRGRPLLVQVAPTLVAPPQPEGARN